MPKKKGVEEEPSALEILQAEEEEKQRVREIELERATRSWLDQQKNDLLEEQRRLKKKEKEWKAAKQNRVNKESWDAAKVGLLPRIEALIIDHGAIDGAFRGGDNWSAKEVAEHEGFTHIVEWFELGERSARTFKRASRKEQEELDEELYQACRDSDFDQTKELLFEGARPDGHRNFWGLTALHKATLRKRKGGLPTMQLLLEAGADVNAVDRKDGSTALHKAAGKGYSTKVEWLLLHGAAINSQDYNLETALHRATDHGHVDTVRLLVNHGIDIKIKNRTQRDAANIAVARDSKQHSAIVTFLDHVPWNVAETRADRHMIFEKAMKEAEKALSDKKEEKKKLRATENSSDVHKRTTESPLTTRKSRSKKKRGKRK